MIHKKNCYAIGKVVAIREGREPLVEEAVVSLLLKDGRARPFRLGDLRDATKQEKRAFEKQ
jgi:hypothetical protein